MGGIKLDRYSDTLGHTNLVHNHVGTAKEVQTYTEGQINSFRRVKIPASAVVNITTSNESHVANCDV